MLGAKVCELCDPFVVFTNGMPVAKDIIDCYENGNNGYIARWHENPIYL